MAILQTMTSFQDSQQTISANQEKKQEPVLAFNEKTLDSCSIGFEGKVLKIKNLEKNIHFLENGFTPNSDIKVLFKAPLGDPIAVQIRGTIIALRKEEAACICV